MKSIFLTASLAAALILSVSDAMAGKLIPIPPIPDSTSMFVHGINDKNEFTGGYYTPDGEYGYIGTIDGQYQTFDVPLGGAGVGINNSGYVTVEGGATGDNISDSLLRKPDGTIVPITLDGDTVSGVPQQIVDRQNELLPVSWTPSLGAIMRLEVGHGTSKIHERVQA